MPTNTEQNISEQTVGVDDRHLLAERYLRVRQFSREIARELTAEDCAIQSMPDVSPTRWHLAHTTWFFETFLLKQLPDYEPFDESFEYLFNSYYNTVGEQFPREKRGLISRPGLHRTLAYRDYVDACVAETLSGNSTVPENWLTTLSLGLQHEQQHQELMFTDIKHVLSCNPLFPAYATAPNAEDSITPAKLEWIEQQAGVVEIGFDGTGFAFDNESPRHNTYLQAHELATRCVTNAEFLDFMQDGGYSRPELWLSMGWGQVQQDGWTAPLYWNRCDDEWREFTLSGLHPLRMSAPVCHVSYFEADAYARWAGCRLPTEFEWEYTAVQNTQNPNGQSVFSDTLLAKQLPIQPCVQSGESCDLMGNVWQWTSSQYMPYPGFSAASGALGEYNGKFMCNQFVLRGGSCATSSDHIRPTYRNFFPPGARWQFTGIRLAR